MDGWMDGWIGNRDIVKALRDSHGLESCPLHGHKSCKCGFKVCHLHRS